jgi:uncharacterized membrane protein YqgA involved in biofilm formation
MAPRGSQRQNIVVIMFQMVTGSLKLSAWLQMALKGSPTILYQKSVTFKYGNELRKRFGSNHLVGSSQRFPVWELMTKWLPKAPRGFQRLPAWESIHKMVLRGSQRQNMVVIKLQMVTGSFKWSGWLQIALKGSPTILYQKSAIFKYGNDLRQRFGSNPFFGY